MSITFLVNPLAVVWAKENSAATITSDGHGGEISNITKQQIREDIVLALEQGWSVNRLTRRLRDQYGFPLEDAQTIAQDELAMAESNGNLQAYIASGVVRKKQWLRDEDQCPVCRANADQGPIDLMQPFASGVQTTPAHPRCRCCVSPVVD